MKIAKKRTTKLVMDPEYTLWILRDEKYEDSVIWRVIQGLPYIQLKFQKRQQIDIIWKTNIHRDYDRIFQSC
jgi:hypothetical protein